MPVYEYEPADHECLMCPNRIEVIQGLNEAPLVYCPHCGLAVRRVISQATIRLGGQGPDTKAGRAGFTTYRRAEHGVWEKTDGEGPDMMVGTKDDVAAVEAERKAEKKIVDLDEKG